MAFETGTANDHKDLLNKLHTFLTGLASNAWVVNRFTSSDELFLKGVGSSGTDEIFCSIKIDENVGADYFNWRLAGAIGYSAQDDQANQPGASDLVYTHLWDQSIPYWFVANGRRFIVIAKISTTYHGLYIGFILPYATPNQYPYPLYIGGETNLAAKRWSDTTGLLRMFWNPSTGGNQLFRNDGQWLDWANFNTVDATQTLRNIHPYVGSAATNYKTIGVGLPPGGEYPLTPLVMIERSPTEAIMGELESCFAVTGFGNASENTVTISSKVHVVFQNVYRTDIFEYFALAQE